MRDAVAFDMDGTLCDTSAVEHLVDEDFAAFQAAAVACPPNEKLVAETRRQAEAGRAVLIITSREFIWRDHTLDWLVANGVPYEHLYMRVVGDYRPDVQIKGEIVTQIADDGFRLLEVWDDSERVRGAYEALGVVAHDVN